MPISLRGVARRYASTTGGFSVRNRIFGGSSAGGLSLRNRLVALARHQESFSVSECIYAWTAAFEQVWSDVVIRIRLNPDAGISNATVNNLQTTWANGIRNTWSNRWGVGQGAEATCALTFDVQWVANNEHHTVRVRVGPGRSNMLLWDTQDTGGVAAHEYGHMFGQVDEYSDANCPGRSPVNTGTVMDNNSNIVPSRMMDRLASNLGSQVVGLP